MRERNEPDHAAALTQAAVSRLQASEVAARQRQVLLETCQREIPIASLAFVAIIVIFDGLTVHSGTSLPTGYLLSDLAQGLGFLAVVLLVGRRVTPASAAPWLWVVAVAISGAAISYQFTVAPGGPSFGILVFAAAVYGSLTLMWWPYLASAIALLLFAGTALVIGAPDDPAPWIITYVVSLGGSAALLFARRRSSLDVAKVAAELARAATRDALTGLLNRHGLDEAAPLLMSSAQRSGQPLHAFFIDVGGLGDVNNEHGHLVGDLVLERTADAVRRASRTGDLVVRWGGDEFLVVGVGAQPDASDFEGRMRESLDMDGLDGLWNGRLHVGLAVDHVDGLDDLIGRADEHMYLRRNGG
jgi:diguanylate cyclase (GGDEF)-like protein